MVTDTRVLLRTNAGTALRVRTSGRTPAASRRTWQVNMGGVEKFPFLAVHVCTTTSPLFHIFEGRPRRLTKPGKNTPELARRRIIPVIPTVRGSEPPLGRKHLCNADVPRFSRFFSPRVWKPRTDLATPECSRPFPTPTCGPQ